NNAGAVTIADEAVTPTKISPSDTNGQVLTTNGLGEVAWAPPTTPIIAFGKIDSNGSILKNIGINNINYDGSSPGLYTITLTGPLTDVHYIIQLTLLNNTTPNLNIQVTEQNPNNFTVQITDSVGIETDSAWFFTIID